MPMIRLRFEGSAAFLQEPGDVPPVPRGGEFDTTRERFDALKAMGIHVVEVDAVEGAAPARKAKAEAKK